MRYVYFQKELPIEALQNITKVKFLSKVLRGHFLSVTGHLEWRLRFGNPHKMYTAMKDIFKL